MDEDGKNFVESALKAGAAISALRDLGPGGVPLALAPNNWALLSLEKYLPRPSRNRGTVKLHDKTSFVQYVHEYHIQDESLILYSASKTCITAIFNHTKPVTGDTPGLPGWADFRALYDARLDRRYASWNGSNKLTFTQEKFAAFVEERAEDFLQPPAADMMSLAANFDVSRKMVFSKSIRLADGTVSLVYSDKDGADGALRIPQTFHILIPIFMGEKPEPISARLKYRIKEKELEIWYELVDVDSKMENAFQRIVEEIARETNLKVYAGEM